MTTATRRRGRPRTEREPARCVICGRVVVRGPRCRTCAAEAQRKPQNPRPERPQGSGKRGPVKGTKAARNHSHICPVPGCPRKGAPFMGTAKARYCSRSCQRRAQTLASRPGEYYAFPGSSNIADLLYLPRQTRLVATFTDGRRYSYSGVSYEIWQRLLEEGRTSIGQAFARLIRPSFEAIRTAEERPQYEPVTIPTPTPG